MLKNWNKNKKFLTLHSFSLSRREHYTFAEPLEIPTLNLQRDLGEFVSKFTGFNEEIKMAPIQLEKVMGEIFPIGYRVLTEDLKSLGLRNNPHIKEYPVGKWFFLDNEEIIPGYQDYGGIHLRRTPGGARQIMNYMDRKYGEKVRIFKAAFNDIIHHKESGVKTDGILMYEEITKEFR